MLLLAIGGGAAFLLAVFLLLFFRLASRFDAKACSPQWLDEFSPESYAPMERLLDRSDFEFLATLPGYHAAIGKKFLAERRKTFYEFLALLIRDFNQLHFVARQLLVAAAEDRPDFARALWRQQIKFYFSVCVVRCKVALYPLGWTPVDVPQLLHALERMRRQIQEIGTPVAAGAFPA